MWLFLLLLRDRGASRRAVICHVFFSPHCFEILVFQTCLKKILIRDESSRSNFLSQNVLYLVLIGNQKKKNELLKIHLNGAK